MCTGCAIHVKQLDVDTTEITNSESMQTVILWMIYKSLIRLQHMINDLARFYKII